MTAEPIKKKKRKLENVDKIDEAKGEVKKKKKSKDKSKDTKVEEHEEKTPEQPIQTETAITSRCEENPQADFVKPKKTKKKKNKKDASENKTEEINVTETSENKNEQTTPIVTDTTVKTEDKSEQIDKENDVSKDTRKKKKKRKKQIKPLPNPDPGAFEAMLVSEKEDKEVEVQEIPQQESPEIVKESDSSPKAKIRKVPKKEKNKTKEPAKFEEKKEEEDSQHAKTQAIEYLEQWDTDKENWSFKKVRQTWLLQHIFDDDAIDKKQFKVLLRYLQGAKGSAKTKTIEDAEKYFNENNESQDAADVKLKRAKKIIQHVTE